MNTCPHCQSMKHQQSSWFSLLLTILVLGTPAAARSGPATLDAKSDTAVSKYEYPTNLTAEIYALGSKNLLFRFTRSATHSGATLSVQRDFVYPDGKLADSEHVTYQGDQLLRYDLKELQLGAVGSARIRRSPTDPAKGSIEFEYRAGPDSRLKTSTEALAPDTLVGDMIAPFLISHWQALQRGEKVKCRYIVVPRLETVGFTFVKDAKRPPNRANGTVIKMEPTSRIIAALVDPLFFTIETASPHNLLDCTGRTTPKLQVKGKWKDLDAFTVFESHTAR
ncbi:MAG: hypothetical protein C5B50_21465 [Verrucomicrobia bacterium]|nr:MAG: hypothetical protein C5B50_21465 [Verrucomicrobiota bacterium]